MHCTEEGITSTKTIRLQHLRDAPESYITYNECEKKCNVLVEKFQNDFLASNPLLKDRLLLQPTNEYGTKKFVCTYIQQTLLPHPEFYDLQTCAQFIARYVTYEPLVSLFAVVSPSQTLEWAVGDCFDISFLLASLLLGAGYDAYVVFGEASKWITLKDQSHMCALLREDEIVIKDDCYAQKDSSGQDIHCWVLVKSSGKRDVDNCYWVEPSTGLLYPVDTNCPYTSVYSIWNDKNCWVNIGDGGRIDCEDGLDFDNTKQWISVLPDAYSTPVHSWANPIILSKDKHLLRYPTDGRLTICLNRAKIELYGENVDPQGVVTRVVQYEDNARTIVVECTELFSSRRRSDCLVKRIRLPKGNLCSEYFSVSNAMFVTERTEVAGKMSCIKFQPKTRVDGLVKRDEDIGEDGPTITEHFQHRSDGLTRRVIHISLLPKDEKKPKASALLPSTSGGLRTIDQIDEHFEEGSSDADTTKTVACRSFLLKEGTVKETYHSEHEVLRETDVYNINDGKDKFRLEMMNNSVSSVKKIQSEIMAAQQSQMIKK